MSERPEASLGRWLALVESFGEAERRASLAFVAGQKVDLDEDELNEALRRAIVVRAVGGDPHRELALDEEAVTRLTQELDGAARREQLRVALVELASGASAGTAVADAVSALVESPDLAWRTFCAALLADELGGE